MNQENPKPALHLIIGEASERLASEIPPAVSIGHCAVNKRTRQLVEPLPTDVLGAEIALQICSICIVKNRCLEEALNTPAQHDKGVRGGATRSQRIQMRIFNNRET